MGVASSSSSLAGATCVASGVIRAWDPLRACSVLKLVSQSWRDLVMPRLGLDIGSLVVWAKPAPFPSFSHSTKPRARNTQVHESGAAFTSSTSNTSLYNFKKQQYWDYLNTPKVEVEAKLGIRPTTLCLPVNWATLTQTSRKAGPANVASL